MVEPSQKKSDDNQESSYRYLPDRADIDSWATRLGALAILSFLLVGEGEAASLYQALIFWSGLILAFFAILPMAKQISIYLSHKEPNKLKLASRAISCVVPVIFIAVTVVVSIPLFKYIYISAPFP